MVFFKVRGFWLFCLNATVQPNQLQQQDIAPRLRFWLASLILPKFAPHGAVAVLFSLGPFNRARCEAFGTLDKLVVKGFHRRVLLAYRQVKCISEI